MFHDPKATTLEMIRTLLFNDNEGNTEVRNMECPSNYEEAVCLVRRYRDGRMDLIGRIYDAVIADISGDTDVLVLDSRGHLHCNHHFFSFPLQKGDSDVQMANYFTLRVL